MAEWDPEHENDRMGPGKDAGKGDVEVVDQGPGLGGIVEVEGPAGGLAKPERPVRRPVNVDEVEVRLFLQDRVGGPERAGDVEPPADVVVDSVEDVAQR